MSASKVRHVISPRGDGEFSACGLAFDSFDSGDVATNDDFASPRPGLIVTCARCKHAIQQEREAFRGLIFRPIERDEA